MAAVFDFKHTSLNQALAFDAVYPQSVRRFAPFSLWFLAALIFLGALFSPQPVLFSLAFLVAAFATSATLAALFFDHALAAPQLSLGALRDSVASARTSSETVNLAPFCAFGVARAVREARGRPGRFLGALAKTIHGRFVYARLGIAPQDIALVAAPDVKNYEMLMRILLEAATHAARRNHRRIEIPDCLLAVMKSYQPLKQLLFDRDIRPEDGETAIHWEDRMFHEQTRKKRFWSKDAILSLAPMGREWAAGYSPTLDAYSRDIWGHAAASAAAHALVRQKEIERIEYELAEAAENNIVLVGESGIAKTAIVQELARRVNTGKSLAALNWKRMVMLDLGAALAGLRTRGETEERVRAVFSEAARAGNIILVVENFHTFLGSRTTEGVVDVSGIVLPFIQGSRLQLLALTTPQGFRETIERRQDLLVHLKTVELEEFSQAVLMQALASLVSGYENRYKVFITIPTVRTCLEYAERFIQDIPYPEKGVQLLEAATIVAARAGSRMVLPEHVAQAVSEKSHIPAGAVAESEREKLLHLEDLLHKRVVNQERAISVVANAMRRARAGVATRKRPIGTFLFLGPTGVGKTETAKALAESYFGSDERMLRFDMSEYQGPDAVSRLLGSPQTQEDGTVTSAIRANPFSLVLLDEFEKAYPKALDLFLQVFDEGRLTDGWGRAVSFRNAILIATSNAGAEFIRQRIVKGEDTQTLADDLIEHVLSGGIFRPELINRFDAVVVYRPLTPEHVVQIAQKMLSQLSASLLQERGVKLEVSNDGVKALAQKGYSPEFGGREMARVIQEEVENVIARKILEGELKRGSVFRVTASDLKKISFPQM